MAAALMTSGLLFAAGQVGISPGLLYRERLLLLACETCSQFAFFIIFFSCSFVVHGVNLAGFLFGFIYFCQKDGAWKGLLAMAAVGAFLPPVGTVWVCTKPKFLSLGTCKALP